MNIGEKIKRLRTSKLMTQSELAGSEITRNMLSRIENDAALPSLGTVRYLANRLNVSAGYLIADSEEEQIYDKHNEIMGIKNSYAAGDYKICRDMCLNANSVNDDEITLILSECALKIAIDEFNEGNLHNACSYFDEAIETCKATVYYTDHIVSIAGVYFMYMNQLSATLDSSAIDIESLNIYSAMTDDFCRYSFLINKKDIGVYGKAANDLPANSPYAMHFDAKAKMSEKDFEEAYKLLHEILYGSAKVPQPVLYFILGDLEICCKELNDYKNAYAYSNEKLSIIQKLLS